MAVAGAIAKVYSGASFDQFKTHFSTWRGRGLTYVLRAGVAEWPSLPSLQMALKQVKDAKNRCELDEGVRMFVDCCDWTSHVGVNIMGTLEKLAVGMGIKSNGPEFDLGKALKDFPDLSEASPYEIWMGARGALEKCLPPGLMCPRMCGRIKRASWGYRYLTPTYEHGVLSVEERSLDWVEQDKQETFHFEGRLPDVLSRMGALLLTPEFGHMMLLAMPGRETLNDGVVQPITPGEQAICDSPRLQLYFMGDPTKFASDIEDVRGLEKALEQTMPKVEQGGKVRLLAWRVDPPSKVVMYAGGLVKEGEPLPEPHRLKKLVLDEKTKARPIGGIEVGGKSLDIPHVLRRHAKEKLGWPGMIMEDFGTHTALIEGLSVFCLSPPSLHTRVTLHASPKWDNTHEDPRYAETQTASNGERYREWVCVAEKGQNHKVRLEAHLLESPRTFWTQFAWRRADDSIQWVPVCSSIHPGGLKVLKERVWPTPSEPSNRKDLHALLMSVKSRFIQDLKLLPVREGERVDKNSTSVYVDEQVGQVMVVYAPMESDRLEFIAFQLPSCE